MGSKLEENKAGNVTVVAPAPNQVYMPSNLVSKSYNSSDDSCSTTSTVKLEAFSRDSNVKQMISSKSAPILNLPVHPLQIPKVSKLSPLSEIEENIKDQIDFDLMETSDKTRNESTRNSYSQIESKKNAALLSDQSYLELFEKIKAKLYQNNNSINGYSVGIDSPNISEAVFHDLKKRRETKETIQNHLSKGLRICSS